MIRHTPVLAATAVVATVALSACGGSDTKAAPNPTTTVSVATASATTTTSTTPVATTSSSSVAAAPSTSATQAVTNPVATATVTRTASARPTATATITRGAVPTKAGGCRTSDGTLLNLDGVSCGFAQNGYAAFKVNRDYLMRAYSPTAHKYYTFTCSEDGVHIVACGGGTMNPNSLFSWQD